MTLSPLILTVCVVVFAATIIALALSLVWNNKLIGSNEQYLRERDFYREQLERTCDLITNALRRQVEGLDEELRSYRAAFSGRPDIQAEAFKRMAEDMRTLSIIVDYAEATPRWNLFQLLADIRTRLTIVRVVLSGSPALSEEMRERLDVILEHLKLFAVLTGFYLRFKQFRYADGRMPWGTERWNEQPVAEDKTVELQHEARQILGIIEKVPADTVPGTRVTPRDD